MKPVLPRWGSLSSTWAKQGHQPEAPTSGKRKGYKVFGAIDYFSGRLFFQGIEGRFNSDSYQAFLVKFRRTHGKTRTTERHVIMALRVIGQVVLTTLDTTRCGPVGQANASLPPFGGLPVEPSDGRSEVGPSDPVQPVLRGVDYFHCVPLLGLIGEKGQRYRRWSREFLSALRCH